MTKLQKLQEHEVKVENCNIETTNMATIETRERYKKSQRKLTATRLNTAICHKTTKMVSTGTLEENYKIKTTKMAIVDTTESGTTL